MSNFLKTSVLLLALACAAGLQAQQISAEDQKGIEACYNGFMTAFDKMDASAFNGLFTENADHIDPTGTLVHGRSNLVAYFGKWFEMLKSMPKPDRVERNDSVWNNRYLASDLILATYNSDETLYFGDQKQVQSTAIAVLLRKQNGKWLAELVSVTPKSQPGQH